MLKSTKRNVPLSECLQDIKEREDDLERHSSQARQSENIRRVSNCKNSQEKKRKNHHLRELGKRTTGVASTPGNEAR